MPFLQGAYIQHYKVPPFARLIMPLFLFHVQIICSFSGHNQANIDQFSAWLPFRPLPPPLSPPPLLISGKATAWIPPLPPLPLYLPAMQLPVFPQGTSVPRGYQVWGGGGEVRRCGNWTSFLGRKLSFFLENYASFNTFIIFLVIQWNGIIIKLEWKHERCPATPPSWNSRDQRGTFHRGMWQL